MVKSFLYDLLIDPSTGEPLVFDEATNTLISSNSGHKYYIIESIPHILSKENQFLIKSDLHREFDTNFKYIDHYRIDAENFDYSEQNISKVTKDEFKRLRESILKEISEEMSFILDIGCGKSWVSKELIPQGKKVISMDISPINPLKAIKQVSHKDHAGLVADAYNIPIRENSIDCIIASEILEHVPDPKTFISKSIALLKNGGKLIITTPYNEKIEYNICVHCNKPTPRFAHLYSFNENKIIQFLPETGITWTSKKFSNKYLTEIRSYIFLKFFPFNFWKAIDSLFNKIFSNPTRLQIVITKR
jgi:2-polyprenyl-3-methyl-5-hydroxy-6-metoxy-1,4-benzoquinol methylase/uncharacterized protein YbaR (Trm112 family)